MSDFSVVEGLIKLRDKNYDVKINNTIKMLVENYDEGQIRVLAEYQGLKIDGALINLFFIENVGFRCFNDRTDIYGKMPICKNVEKFMNNIYLESFNIN